MRATTALTAAWAALHTLQFGFAIGGLNGIQAVMTCGGALATPTPLFSWYLLPCVPMSVSPPSLHVIPK